MPRRSHYDEEFDFDDEDYDNYKRGPRKFKKEEKESHKRKHWERESAYDRDHDYDERR